MKRHCAIEITDLDTWKRIIDYWRSCDLTIRPGVSPAAIAEFESQHTVLFPDTLRSYFLAVDGMEDEMDPDLYRFWPLADVRRVETELTDDNPPRDPLAERTNFHDWEIQGVSSANS